jgi:ketosteroid isomerase-like protein
MQSHLIRTLAGSALVMSSIALSSPLEDRQIVAALDGKYQLAVKRNDAETMARILHKDFVLVLGNGRTYSHESILEEARSQKVVYEHQEEDEGTRTVHVWGDTAVVTARLWLTGVNDGVPFGCRLWFSDTYVRTAKEWRYVFGQASLCLPKDSQADAPASASR